MSLAEKAAQAAGRPAGTAPETDPAATPEPQEQPTVPQAPTEPPPTLELNPDRQVSPDHKQVPVHVALLRAIRDLGHVKKTGQFSQGQTRYSYRGVDAVVNAAKVVMQEHGILFLPEVRHHEDRDIARSAGGRSGHALLRVRWHIIGPMGDILPGVVETVGMAMDTSDKDFNKAHSVAWRIALVQVFQMVTGDPDPDAVRIDRGDAPGLDPNAYRDEALDPDTPVARLSQMIHDLKSHGKGDLIVENEVGEPEKVGNLVWRIRRTRTAGEPS